MKTDRSTCGYTRFLQLTVMTTIVLAMPLMIAQTVSRFVGTVTAISGDTMTVKTDDGSVRQVTVPASAVVKRVEPGQKDLSSAATIQLADLETGDRVLVKLDTDAAGPVPEAAQIVTIKRADVAQKQQQDREDWQLHGVGGLVKSVDPGAGVIVLTSGAGSTAKTVTVHVAKSTVLKRYAPASIRFDLAQPAPIDAIQAGDQLRARGAKNPDGTELNATEVVSGSFRNIAGTVTSLDSASSTMVIKDLATRKQVTIHITPDAQMHALPEPMARMLAARLKGNTPGANGGAPGPSSGTGTGAGPGAGAGHGPESRNGNAPQGPGQSAAPGSGDRPRSGGAGRGQSGGDMQQILNRAPAIQFADLKKGEAVMLVSTAGSSDVTAITLLTGVEPLLEAPEASRNLLSNWSMGTGGAGEAEAQ
jgi:hypothetical protein